MNNLSIRLGVRYGVLIGIVLSLLTALEVMVPFEKPFAITISLFQYLSLTIAYGLVAYIYAVSGLSFIRIIKMGTLIGTISWGMKIGTVIVITYLFTDQLKSRPDLLWQLNHSPYKSMMSFLNSQIYKQGIVLIPVGIIISIASSVVGALTGQIIKKVNVFQQRSNESMRKIKRLIPYAVIITSCFLTVLTIEKQLLRLSIDQQQDELASTLSPEMVFNFIPVDISKSLLPFIMLLNNEGTVVYSTAFIGNESPQPPPSVINSAQQYGSHRFIWQPGEKIKMIVLVKPLAKPQTGYVVIGQSLRLIDEQTTVMSLIMLTGWFFTIVLIAVVVNIIDVNYKLSDKLHLKNHRK